MHPLIIIGSVSGSLAGQWYAVKKMGLASVNDAKVHWADTALNLDAHVKAIEKELSEKLLWGGVIGGLAGGLVASLIFGE